ncbi:MAG: DUF4876 domain-containing protein [Bacteroides sp.]|nr:DUF4876 domain-containing protein [Bacteroides sp.]
MNKKVSFISKMMMFAATTVFMAACSDSENVTQAVTVQVQVLLPEGFSSDAAYSGQTVTLGSYTATTDDTGVATFEGVIPDVYDIATSCEITADQYREMTGNDESQNLNYILTGSLLNQTVATATTISLQTSASVKQSLVISKVYYSGTKDNNSKNYLAGKYLEFFNNSDETIDIAGIYFGLIESNSTPAYDLGTTPDYIYLKQIYRFPTESAIEVAAGEAIVVANSAIDHTANNEVDLSGADFEAKDEAGKTTNNPDVPAIELIYTFSSSLTYMNLVQGGPCSIVLFETDEDIDNWERVYADGKTSGSQYVKMPIKYVTDGVDCLKNKTTGVDVDSKRLYDYIDAGYQNIEAISGYTGEVVYRKVSTTENGRTVLADTNNSTNDFAVSTTILPKQFE